MDHVGAHPSRGGGYLEWGLTAGQQRARGPEAADGPAVALQQFDLVPLTPQQCGDLGDRSLLPAGKSVAVVDDQNAHRGPGRYRRR